MVYITSNNDQMQAFSETTGKLVWQQPGGNNMLVDGSYSPAVANGVVYADTGAGFAAFDAKTDKILYQYTTQARNTASLAVANGMVFFGTSDCHMNAFRIK